MDFSLPKLPNPLDLVRAIKIPNPLDLLPDMPSMPKMPSLPSMPEIPHMPWMPSMPHLPHLPKMPTLPNPLDLIPDIDIPNPFEGIIDDATRRGKKAGNLYNAIQNGEKNTGPNPALAHEGQDLKAKYQEAAYKAMGIDEKEFSTMDPIARNGLINAAYAKMYKKDPETYKWAGMAAMASDKAGTGMMQTYMLEGADVVPGADKAADAVGAPDGKKVRDLLAKGNAGIFNDMMWQHMAFDSGGIGEMQKAFKEGSITKEQLDGWSKLADSKEKMDAAKKSGNPEDLKKAQDGIWEGNKGLLKEEQQFVQDLIYDESPESRAAFKFLSGPMNVMGVTSPVPDGTKFGDHRKGKGGGNDVGNFEQRWKWIEDDMLPEYQKFESNSSAMDGEMDKYVKREKKSQWNEKAWDPANKIIDDAINPIHSPLINPFHGLFD